MANGKTILIVDDDPGARRLLQFVLGKTGCEILTVANGTQALKIATTRTIHLMVTDLMMEGMDGFTLTKDLHQIPAYARLPIIMLSARWQIEYRDELWNSEDIVMMAKPFSPTELISEIQRMLHL